MVAVFEPSVKSPMPLSALPKFKEATLDITRIKTALRNQAFNTSQITGQPHQAHHSIKDGSDTPQGPSPSRVRSCRDTARELEELIAEIQRRDRLIETLNASIYAADNDRILGIRTPAGRRDVMIISRRRNSVLGLQAQARQRATQLRDELNQCRLDGVTVSVPR